MSGESWGRISSETCPFVKPSPPAGAGHFDPAREDSKSLAYKQESIYDKNRAHGRILGSVLPSSGGN